MNTYKFGPLTVEVEALGKVKSPWDSIHYNVKVTDRHGHEFKAGWYSVTEFPKNVAFSIVSLLSLAKYRLDDENFEDYFSSGYGEEEQRWKAGEARKLQAAAKAFDRGELTKATAEVRRMMEYERYRGPRDWSPRRELPE